MSEKVMTLEEALAELHYLRYHVKTVHGLLRGYVDSGLPAIIQHRYEVVSGLRVPEAHRVLGDE